MILYFSGTGNSRYAAKLLADKLGDECADAGSCIRSGSPAAFSSEKPWVFVSPTYAWRLPRVFEAFLRSARFSGDKRAYFVLTCGSETGNAAAGLKRLCLEKGFEYRGLLGVVMPENYVAMFPVPDEDTSARLVRVAERTLRRGAESIEKGEPFPEAKTGLADRLKSGPVNKAFYALFVHDKKFTVSSSCTGCGACAKLCPLNNITLTEGRPVWNGSCTHCMACICRCPAGAVEYGKNSLGKRRYTCPEYEG